MSIVSKRVFSYNSDISSFRRTSCDPSTSRSFRILSNSRFCCLHVRSVAEIIFSSLHSVIFSSCIACNTHTLPRHAPQVGTTQQQRERGRQTHPHTSERQSSHTHKHTNSVWVRQCEGTWFWPRRTRFSCCLHQLTSLASWTFALRVCTSALAASRSFSTRERSTCSLFTSASVAATSSFSCWLWCSSTCTLFRITAISSCVSTSLKLTVGE